MNYFAPVISMVTLCSLMIFFGAAIGQPKVDHSNKAKVETVKFGKMVDITVLPAGDYKWNEKYPARLTFSLCNDTQCVTITKEIKIKKD